MWQGGDVREDQRQPTMWLVGIIIVTLLAVASSAGIFRSFEADPIDSGQAARRALVGGLAGLLVVAGAVVAVRRSGSASRVRAAAFGTVTLVAFASLLITAFAATGASTATDPPVVRVETEAPPPPVSAAADTLPLLDPLKVGNGVDNSSWDLDWVVTVFKIAALTLTVYVLARLWAMRRRRRPGPGVASPHDATFAEPVPLDLIDIDNEAAADSFANSVQALLDDDDPRRAIIAAYAALLEGLELAGAGREPHEAPEEHLRRSLVKLRVPSEALAEVTRLFLVAKFSNHPMTETDRNQARSMLAVAEQHLRAIEPSDGGRR